MWVLHKLLFKNKNHEQTFFERFIPKQITSFRTPVYFHVYLQGLLHASWVSSKEVLLESHLLRNLQNRRKIKHQLHKDMSKKVSKTDI